MKHGVFDYHSDFLLDRISHVGPDGTQTYRKSWFGRAYWQWRIDNRLDDGGVASNLVFAASLMYKQSPVRKAKRQKTKKPSQHSRPSHPCSIKLSISPPTNKLDTTVACVFKLEGRAGSPATAFIQAAVHRIGSYAACGCLLGGFAVGKEYACMIVVDDDTILVEVPNGTPMEVHVVDDTMAFMSGEFSFPHALEEDESEALEFIWNFLEAA
ncbi:hypothetical protein IAR50_004920 [Cryptococcus sp. DSM 104548]